MDAELHLDPDRLHAHGLRLAGVLDGLVPLPVLDADSAAALTAHGRADAVTAVGDLLTGVGRIGRELAELAAALHETAGAVEEAERQATRELTRPWWDRA